jgi:AbiU2
MMIIGRLEPSLEIPAELREIYGHVAGSLIDTLGVLDELTILFSTSREAVDLMNQTAPTFFVRHEQLLFHHIILFVSRLTDDKRSGSRKNPQENLTLSRLLDLEPEYHKLRVDLRKKLGVIKEDAKPMRLFRHKVLAHASLVHHLSLSTKLAGDITLKSMKDLLNKIGDYLVTFDCFFTRVDAQLYYSQGYGEASDLLAYLRRAVDAETKQNDDRRLIVDCRSSRKMQS